MKSGPKKRKNSRVLIWVTAVLFALLIAVAIHYRGVRPIVKNEYGEPISASDFTQRDAALNAADTKLPLGWHVLNLSIGGVPTPVFVHTVDTIAPTAEPVDRIVPLGTAMKPDAFVTHIKDADTVRVAFEMNPDFSVLWDGTIHIVLSDSSGNRTIVASKVKVRAAVDCLTLEAGEDVPDVRQFLLDGVSGTMLTSIEPETMRHVASVPIAIAVGDKRVETELRIIDTQAPQAEPTLLVLKPGETAEPVDFVLRASDETDLAFAFSAQPDYENRALQTVAVSVTDEGGNTTEVNSKLLITGVQPHEIEAREEALTPDDFENLDGQTLEIERFIPDTPGTFPVSVTVNGVPETLAVTVVDTTPPTLTPKPIDVNTLFYAQHDYQPQDFFEVYDLAPVALAFAETPDFTVAGWQTVTAIAKDMSGNETSASVNVYLRIDRTPPHIYGAINRIFYVNEPIAYLAEVFAEDDVDGAVELTVDSEVLSQEEGSYRVVYRAEDRSGNRSEAACTFTLIRRTVTEEETHALAQSILNEITTPDMVDAEVLKAIFDYVQGHIVYANGVNNHYSDWRKAAFDGYTQGTGDCFNIYALTRMLLDEAGIRYLSVERVRTSVRKTRHYWVNVNLGTGWYVFDPTWTPKHQFNCFMWTRAECNRCYLYWYYKYDAYPPLATEPFDYDAVVAMEREGRLR